MIPRFHQGDRRETFWVADHQASVWKPEVAGKGGGARGRKWIIIASSPSYLPDCCAHHPVRVTTCTCLSEVGTN